MNSRVIFFDTTIRLWKCGITKSTANAPASPGKSSTLMSSGGIVIPRSTWSLPETGENSGDKRSRWNKSWSDVARQASRRSLIVSAFKGDAYDINAESRSGPSVSSTSWCWSGSRLTMAQYRGVWSSIDFSWRMVERERECVEHASAQLWRMPVAAGELEMCSWIKSRTRRRTVDRTSRAVRDSDDSENLNQLVALALPLALDGIEDEGERGDFKGMGGAWCGVGGYVCGDDPGVDGPACPIREVFSNRNPWLCGPADPRVS